MKTRLSREQRLEYARELVVALDEDESARATQLILELARDHDQDLFSEVGRLTRELHETLNSFLTDSRLPNLATTEMPDARERLNYVIEMTEEAAHKTLGAVEDSLPTLREIMAQAKAFKEAWERFRHREMSIEHFRMLSYDLDQFLARVVKETHRIDQNLSNVMMAQGSQDLAGQLIRQVILLVQEVENNLVEIVRITGQGRSTIKEAEVEASGRGYGPAVPSVDDVACSQDEVDNLLSSLGF